MLRSTDLLALPAVDCDKAYAMQLSLEETLLTTQTVYFQVALLYPLQDIADNYEFACLISFHCILFKAWKAYYVPHTKICWLISVSFVCITVVFEGSEKLVSNCWDSSAQIIAGFSFMVIFCFIQSIPETLIPGLVLLRWIKTQFSFCLNSQETTILLFHALAIWHIDLSIFC